MVGWAEECDSAWWLARDAYEKLKAKDPGHELLKYLHPEKDTVLYWEEMKDRFWDKSRGDWEGQSAWIVQTIVLSNYAFAMDEVLAEAVPNPKDDLPEQKLIKPKYAEEADIPF